MKNRETLITLLIMHLICTVYNFYGMSYEHKQVFAPVMLSGILLLIAYKIIKSVIQNVLYLIKRAFKKLRRFRLKVKNRNQHSSKN